MNYQIWTDYIWIIGSILLELSDLDCTWIIGPIIHELSDLNWLYLNYRINYTRDKLLNAPPPVEIRTPRFQIFRKRKRNAPPPHFGRFGGSETRTPPPRRRRKIFRGILRVFLTKITILGETETRTPLNSEDLEEEKKTRTAPKLAIWGGS